MSLENNGSDSIIFEPSRLFESIGVTGFKVITAQRKWLFSIEQMSLVSHNPHRGTITFCLKGPEKTPRFFTFQQRKTEFTIFRNDPNPTALRVEEYLNKP